MTRDRIQRALDGEIPAEQLTAQERTELHRYRAAIGTALGRIRHLPSIDVAPEVMERVVPMPGPVRRALGKVVDWLWSPRAITVRPAFAVTGALAIAGMVSISAVKSPAPLSPVPARVIVQFRLGAPEALDVTLVGDFNDWRPEHRLHQTAAGVWSVDVALEPGVYNYVFVVDGKTWRLDPLAPQVTDGFGGSSSRIAVLAPEVRS